MALYETLTRIDVMEPIAQKLVNRQMEIDPDDQRATIQGKSILPKPWILSGIDTERNCSIWFSFIFENYNLIHPGCRSCWKICYRPRNLDELFFIYKLQQEMKNEFIPGTEFHYHGKCGVERRAYVGNQGGYSSFWYNPLSCGLETARKIRLAVYDRISKKINPEPKVILKRGCTEMELSYPPSDNWEEYAKKYDWDEKLTLNRGSSTELSQTTYRRLPNVRDTYTEIVDRPRGAIRRYVPHALS